MTILRPELFQEFSELDLEVVAGQVAHPFDPSDSECSDEDCCPKGNLRCPTCTYTDCVC